MQRKNLQLKQFDDGRSKWAKAWLSCGALLGVLSYLTSTTGFADPPPPWQSFDALQQSGSIIIPFTNGAVSRNFVMTALQDNILVQRKDSTHVTSPMTEIDWWVNGGPPNGLYCGIWPCIPIFPTITFDPSSNRWFFATRDYGELNRVFLAISKTEDPSNPSDWYKWTVISTGIGGISNYDGPRIGFSNKWFAIEVDNTAYNDPPFSSILVFDKAELLAGHAPVAGQNWKWFDNSPNLGLYMCPARTYDPGVSDLYLLQSTKFFNAGGTNDRLTYYRIYGNTIADVQLSAGTEVIAGSAWGVASATAPQKGAPGYTIDNDDDRIHECIFRNGCLWAAHTVSALTIPLPPPISYIQWWQIKPGTGQQMPTIVQRGFIDGSGDGNFRSYPTLAVNANENVLIGYNLFGFTNYPSGVYSFRFGTDPLNAMRAQGNCGIGTGPFLQIPYLWGATSAAVIDPVDDRSMWTIQEYAGPIAAMTPIPITTIQNSANITAPIDTFSEDQLGAAISGPGIPDGSFIGVFHSSSSVDLYDATTGAPANATANDTVEAIIEIEPDVPSPRLWATHWVGISVNFGRFVGAQGHSLGLDPVLSTALAASGRNNYGQLGNSSTTSGTSPVSPGGSQPPLSFQLHNIMDVAAGSSTSLAVDTNGSVFVWGANDAGQLGAGSTDTSPHSTPAAIPCASPLPCSEGKFNLFKLDTDGKPYYVPVSTGFGISPTLVSYKLTAAGAVDYLGQVWMWGSNSYGQLGDGTTNPHYRPALVTLPGEVPSFKGAVSIETADNTTTALKADRSVWSWGSGCSGVLGDGDTSCSSTHYVTHPQQVLTGPGQPLAGVVQVACGRLSDFCLALTQDGTVYGWGANGSYQLGLGDTVNRGYATLIPSFPNIRRIAAGGYHSLALASDGRVYAWGQGGYGQTGFGNTGGRAQATPRLMGGTNSQYTDIAAGNNFSLMIRGNAQPQQVWGTGDNTYGQLATGSSTTLYSLPTQTLY